MDILALLLEPIAIVIIISIVVLLYNQKYYVKKVGNYSNPDWNYGFKVLWAKWCIKKYFKQKQKTDWIKNGLKFESPRILTTEESYDSQLFYGVDQNGNSIVLRIQQKRHRVAEVWLSLILKDGRFYQLPEYPDTVVINNNKKQWNAGGIQFMVLEPFRSIRITFNGYLKNCSESNTINNNDVMEHVKINFIWAACTAPIQWPQEQSVELLSENISLETWRDGHWLDMLTHQSISGFDQYGSMFGTIVTKTDTEPIELNLPGIRCRRTSQLPDLRRSVTIVGCSKDGTLFSLGAYSTYNSFTHFKFGNIRSSNSLSHKVTECDLHLLKLAEYSDYIPNKFTINFKANNKNFICETLPKRNLISTLYGGRPWNSQSVLVPCQFNLGKYTAEGAALFWYKYKGPCDLPEMVIPKYLKYLNIELIENQLTVSLSEKSCRSLQVVGGKGASLALLTSITNEEFTVPSGFCLTVSALELQKKNNPEIKKAIEEIVLISANIKTGSLEDACQKTKNIFEEIPIEENIVKAVLRSTEELKKCNNVGGVLENYRFAVRSSAVGEDSEEFSAAGQNETILGCKSEDILKAIQTCWASCFAFQSVQYRRLHGLPINCEMAVVIQLMIPADVAGVMFTCNPTSGDPTEVLITSNYGLGESVVSASVEPDTIILKRTWKDEIFEISESVGKKTHLIKMSNDKTEMCEISNEQKTAISLPKNQALKLANIGIRLEKMFGDPRDIEWALHKNKIYLLQSRPITSIKALTDYELLHEFDTPIVTDQELSFLANIGEVLPGVSSTISQTVIGRCLNETLEWQLYNNKNFDLYKYTNFLVPSFQHQAMLNFAAILLRFVEKDITIANKINDLCLFGCLVTTEEIHQIGLERHGIISPINQMIEFFKNIKIGYNNKQIADMTTKMSEDFKIDLKIKSCTDSKAALEIIIKDLHIINECIFQHNNTSMFSMFGQFILLIILTKGSKDLTNEHLQDISLLLSSCNNAVSAEVPKNIERIAEIIYNENLVEEFLKLEISEIRDWFLKKCPKAADVFDEFLKKHGHRCIRELDLIAIPYEDDYTALLQSIKAVVGSLKNDVNNRNSNILTPQETVARLITPCKWTTKKFLQFMVPICRRSVERREQTKSALVLCIHKTRLAFRHLAKIMLKEGKLPDTDLIYHLSLYEITRIINDSATHFISKAIRRKRLIPQWNKIHFEILTSGVPKPIESISKQSISTNKNDIKVKGVTVYPGNITGRACVINSLNEINQLQPGDILITHCTDVAWSPYFPILSGVVTELGGLVSHGAVVAREYGLPCIIGAQGATEVFKTGDNVLLAAGNGEIVIFD